MGWSAFRQTGLTHYNPTHSVKGYTLFTPAYARGVYLIDIWGQIVKKWDFGEVEVSQVVFRPNGNLFLTGVLTSEKLAANALDEDDYSNIDLHCLRLGAGVTTMREYDWDGNLIWQYDNPRMHHDFHLYDNGDIAFLEWVPFPKEFADTIQGGYTKNPHTPKVMLGDDIVRINPTGEEIGRWRTWEMLDPVEDPIAPLQSRKEWTHANSLDVMPNGDFLVSARQNSRIFIIDPDKREITWKMDDPTVSLPHSATAVPGGNVQVFDNGMHRGVGIPYSRILEFNPEDSEMVWNYTASIPEQFFSGHLSNAQRLDLGNVFICEGTSGRLFEITCKGEIVWEWISPFIGGTPGGRMFAWVYRAHRYLGTHPTFANKDLDPENYRNLNTEFGLM